MENIKFLSYLKKYIEIQCYACHIYVQKMKTISSYQMNNWIFTSKTVILFLFQTSINKIKAKLNLKKKIVFQLKFKR